MATIIENWTADIPIAATSFIIPDGCRDLICLQRPGKAAKWFISALQCTIHVAHQHAGSRLTGFRLYPGTSIQGIELLAQVENQDPGGVNDRHSLDEFTTRSENLTDALNCLTQSQSIAITARHLGVCLRSLQRLVQHETGQTPTFWRQLARVRGAGRLLGNDLPLAEISLDAGFSDQAHMNREFRRWFGVSPKVFSQTPRLMEQLDAAGYG